ncbi:chaperonin 10-like protein [Achaetomium macrosporum]|uniref:Chaperonin 10-like protein n=1 Tax=Achaetomium macrosporum TaxID=79813 RepID=A0AAN7CEM1_9PEZI|nr:chaperonin 10-like protein [Achaetomium macrosporum]
MATPSLPAAVPATHPAVVITGPRQPLQLLSRPTVPPKDGEALIHVTWTASTPLDLHRADGGLAIGTPPFIMGSSFGGTVVALGGHPGHLSVGDKVVGFVQDGAPDEAGFQTYITLPTWKVSKVPANLTLPEAVTVPCNLVTAFHTITEDLGLELPWPVPKEWAPPRAQERILVWGAASSVGMYVLQVLKHWGYRNVLAVASGKHHELLKELGAKECFDYRNENVVAEILRYLANVEESGSAGRPKVPFFVDCIGSKEGTLRPLSKIAEAGSKVAVMLPVINVHASEGQAPEYEMDVSKVLPGDWAEGVQLRGTRTFFYAKNEFFRDHLQPEIVPALLEQGVVQPNKHRVVEGNTVLERAENALKLLRNQAVSGERLVWRIAEAED